MSLSKNIIHEFRMTFHYLFYPLFKLFYLLLAKRVRLSTLFIALTFKIDEQCFYMKFWFWLKLKI